jgi:TDG/mug DNA glycosylase family protein
VLAPGLRVIFCGSAAGTASARAGAYYAGPGNRFWAMLYRTSLTPRLLVPAEYPLLPSFGIGLTDMAKRSFGPDRGLKRADDDPQAVRDKVARLQPLALAFNGKRAARVFLDRADLAYGRQEAMVEKTAIFVLPSTSGAARAFWDEAPWRALAAWLESRSAAPVSGWRPPQARADR